jgi:hypothetical protein
MVVASSIARLDTLLVDDQKLNLTQRRLCTREKFPHNVHRLETTIHPSSLSFFLDNPFPCSYISLTRCDGVTNRVLCLLLLNR